MCQKKNGWKYKSIEEVAEDFIKDFKDEGKILGEFKISVQEPAKKDDKKEKKEEGKKRKKKNKFQELYI